MKKQITAKIDQPGIGLKKLLHFKQFSGFILPWLIVNIVDLGATFVFFVMRLVTQNPSLGGVKILSAVVYHMVAVYFIYTVFVYYINLKKRKKAAAKLVLRDLELEDSFNGKKTNCFSYT